MLSSITIGQTIGPFLLVAFDRALHLFLQLLVREVTGCKYYPLRRAFSWDPDAAWAKELEIDTKFGTWEVNAR